MINPSIVKQTIREVYQQPPITFACLIVIAIVILLIFTFNVEYEGDVIISMSFVGISFDETQVNTLGYELIRSIYNLFKVAFMFLFILQSSTLFPDTLKNPLLGIILTKPISRAGLFLSKYLGQIVAIFSLLLIFGIGIVFLLYLKMNGAIILTPIYISISVFFEFVAIFSFMALLSLIFEKSLAVTVIGLITYFALVPLLEQAKKMGITFASYVSYIFPPLGELSYQSNNIIVGETIAKSIFIPNMLYVVIYISISIYLFKQRNIA